MSATYRHDINWGTLRSLAVLLAVRDRIEEDKKHREAMNNIGVGI